MEVKRKYHIDILRILACFAVVFNHFDPGFFSFNHAPHGSIQYWLLMSLSVFCKFAVPLFFMISGALLLKKEESISKLYARRVSKIAITLFVASICYFFFEKYALNSPNVDISTIYTDQTEYHLWYLYSYLALLISLPYLRSIAKDLTKNKIFYLSALYIFFRYLLPLIELLFTNNTYHLNGRISGIFICADIFFLPLLGYYIENNIEEKSITKNRLLGVWACNILSLLATMYANSLINTTAGNDINQTYIGFFSSTNAIAIYLTAKKIKLDKISNKFKKILLHLSSCTFGIYLVHLVFMRIINTSPKIDFFYGLPIFTKIGFWFGISIIVTIISYSLVAIAKRIPVLKRLF